MGVFRTRYLKRILDLFVVIPGLATILPIMGIVAMLVRLKIGSPVLFRQVRPGIHGKPFTIYKFRTMTDAMDAEGNLLPDGQRLTPLGGFLRSTSLDELPELFNVLKGDMSLVGPRPLVMKYLPYYTDREQLRHSVRPGITGWAQVNGRNLTLWDKRLAMDVWYVENWSIFLDLRILAITVLKVLRREGAAEDPDSVETNLDQERLHRVSDKNIIF